LHRDLIIIGGGPGGYVAAIRAAQLGAKVLIVEKDQLGGTCLNRGCIPTKAFYKNAQILDTLNKSNEFGIEIKWCSLNMAKVQERKDEIVKKLRGGIGQLLKAFGIEIIRGKGSLLDHTTVSVQGEPGNSELIKAPRIIIATGSVPAELPIPGLNLPGVMTSNEALNLGRIPKDMVIIGGGVIGIEFAGIYHAFGAQVTVLEYLPRILPGMDEEIAKRVYMTLKRKGIRIETGINVKEVCRQDSTLMVCAEGKKGAMEVTAESVLVAAGRSINVQGLNLEELGIEYDRTGIKVDERFSTNVPGVYAIGDVIGGQMLAHVASDEGKAAVESMMGLEGHINYSAVPSCVFTFPEVAAVGLTEEGAKSRGLPYLTGKFLFGANGKALTMGEGEGIVKVIAAKDDGRILGVHIFGPHASDLIHEASLAVENKLTVAQITKTVHAHPTLAEAFLEAAMAVEGRAIHLAPAR